MLEICGSSHERIFFLFTGMQKELGINAELALHLGLFVEK